LNLAFAMSQSHTSPKLHTRGGKEVELLDVLLGYSAKPSLQEYKDFLQKECSAENLLFWEKIQHLKHMEVTRSSAQSILEEAVQIYQDFIQLKAPNEVNLPNEIREAITERYRAKNMDACTFTQAQIQAYKLMSQDSFRRFLRDSGYDAPGKRGSVVSLPELKDGAVDESDRGWFTKPHSLRTLSTSIGSLRLRGPRRRSGLRHMDAGESPVADPSSSNFEALFANLSTRTTVADESSTACLMDFLSSHEPGAPARTPTRRHAPP
jgi:hypothetical protein